MCYSSLVKPCSELTYTLLVISVSVVKAKVHVREKRS